MKFYLIALSVYSTLSTLVIFFFVQQNYFGAPDAQDIDYTTVHKMDLTGAPQLGPELAEVTVVVFSDFGCPACGQTFQNLRTIMDQAPGKIRLVHKNLPLDMGQNAPAARAGAAAHLQDGFWEMAQWLYNHYGPVDPTFLEDAAAHLGLDYPTLAKDWADPQRLVEIQLDLDLARELGVDRTPTIFVNGVKLPSHDRQTLSRALTYFLEPSS